METGNSMSSHRVNLLYSYTSSIAQSSCFKKIVRLVSDNFCLVYLDAENTILQLHHYDFGSNVLSMAEKIQAIRDIDETINCKAEKEIFVYHAFANIQLPSHLYSAAVAEESLHLMVPQAENYAIVNQKNEEYDIENISAWPKELFQAVRQYFPDASLQNTTNALLRKLHQQQENVLIFIDNECVTISAKNHRQFSGMNSFAFKHVEDCCYYVMAFLRKMYENVDLAQPVLCGNFVPNSPIYDLLYRYFTNIKIGELAQPVENSYRYYEITFY
ncbi:MAG: DUF3822 family protein [Bacteroidales bacterium]|nr:DUF3822 family protein [Bacteroidales bacterium]